MSDFSTTYERRGYERLVDFADHHDDAPIHISPDRIIEAVLDRKDPERHAPDDALDVAPHLGLLTTADAAPTPWTNINPVINGVGNAQGVEPGTWPWIEAGPAAYSGSAGSQASYGWRHHHKVTPAYIRAAIANMAHRPSYYLNAPFRSFPYGSAGRPIGWFPVEANDLPSGEKLYINSLGDDVKVSGPDAEHFWVTPLHAVFDSPPIMVNVGGGHQRPSTAIAALLLKLQAASVVGMIRDKSGGTSQKPYPWAYGDRANSRILSTIIEAVKRGCLDQADVPTAVYWMRDVLLPWYEATPGISFFNLQPVPANHWSIGCFNGLYWLLPTFYDAAMLFLSSPVTKDLGDRFMVCVQRWSQWALDLEEVVPGRGFNMAQVFLPRKEFRTGGPLASIKALITDPQMQIRFDGITWETWSFRACSVATAVTGSPVLQKARDGILNRRGKDPSNKVWLVNADGSYAA